MNLTERAEVRRETFYKLTNSRDVPEAPSEGGRNYVTNRPANWQNKYVVINGASAGGFLQQNSTTRISPKKFISVGAGKQYTVSLKELTNVDYYFKVTMSTVDSYGVANSMLNKDEWIYSDIYTFTAPENCNYIMISVGCDGGVSPDDLNRKFNIKFEAGENKTPYSQAPEDFGWSKTTLVPTQSNRYLWKFEYIYYSDGNVEVTDPVNLSIAGQDGAQGVPGKPGEDGVIESNGENRIFYGRGDTKKGFFKNATIGTDWNGVPYGEFDLSQWHVTGTTQRWDSVSTTDGLKLLGNSTTIPTGKWTMTQDIYLTDSIEGCGGYNYVRADRLPGEGFHDITYISTPIITNKCRRAIWNPEPDRKSYGGYQLINPLEVNNHNNSPVKITTKCVPDELGNGVTQYIIEPTSSNPTGNLNIPSVRNAIPQDANKTWTATLKIRANKTCKLSHLGFERFSVMHDVTIKPEWQTLYFNGKADGTYGTFVLYGLGPQALSSKVVIEIAEVKICDENVSKEEMSKTLLSRYWYRMSETHEFTEANRIGLNGSVTGGVQISIPAGKKTDAKIRLRNVSLRRGDVEIPFAPAPEDIYDQNDSKVDQDQLDQIANELRDRQDRLAQELAAKALASEVSELTTQIKNLKESDLAGKADITNAVASLEKRLANVIPLGNMAQKLQFIDSYILQGEEGMEIGNKNSGSKVMITPDRIGFFSGGTEVASFSSGQLRINNGFFADTITVGHFMTRRHPNNQYVNGTYFVK